MKSNPWFLFRDRVFHSTPDLQPTSSQTSTKALVSYSSICPMWSTLILPNLSDRLSITVTYAFSVLPYHSLFVNKNLFCIIIVLLQFLLAISRLSQVSCLFCVSWLACASTCVVSCILVSWKSGSKAAFGFSPASESTTATHDSQISNRDIQNMLLSKCRLKYCELEITLNTSLLFTSQYLLWYYWAVKFNKHTDSFHNYWRFWDLIFTQVWTYLNIPAPMAWWCFRVG